MRRNIQIVMIKYIRRTWRFINLFEGLIFISLYIILIVIIGCSLKNIDKFMNSINKIASFLLNELFIESVFHTTLQSSNIGVLTIP